MPVRPRVGPPSLVARSRQTRGPECVLESVENRIWGIAATELGVQQLHRFCEFVRLHQKGVGVKEIARLLSLHRSTVAEWRDGTDQPYLIRAANETLPITPKAGWKVLPMHLTSGGSKPTEWMQVPRVIQTYNDVVGIISQLRPLATTYERAATFGLAKAQVESMRPELFAYLLGIMVGDAGKLGGAQNRHASMNLDLQLTRKHTTNERLGEFVSMCANSLGIGMTMKQDKKPSGDTRFSREPSAAYRWTSKRSPFLAWIFSVGLGLRWDETTTTDRVQMNWIFDAPRSFRI